MDYRENDPLLPSTSEDGQKRSEPPSPNNTHSKKDEYSYLTLACIFLGVFFFPQLLQAVSATFDYYVDSLKHGHRNADRPAPDPFAHLADHCDGVSPISAEEFYARQSQLASALFTLGASAYIAEPGANAQFFGNISSSAWSLSERPLLLIISPEPSSSARDIVSPKVTVLTPSFEASRASKLPVPASSGVTYVAWREEADPYEIATSAIPALSTGKGKIFVDASVRKFIADGLEAAAPEGTQVESAPSEIRQLRERKSKAELEIMRCVNEATLLAIRAVREKMHVGIKESETRSLLQNALATAGVSGGGLVLFGENAAFPHGSGSDRALGKSDFALFDVTANLHSYMSDVTRTFALPGSSISPEQIAIWKLVRRAQSAVSRLKNGTITAKADEAARTVIEDAGYGQYFTHRLGHGIGIETHEQPYLRGGSSDIITTGHTFSNEPGVYIEGKIGVRLEDCFYVDDHGDFVFLTEGVGGQAKDPWNP